LLDTHERRSVLLQSLGEFARASYRYQHRGSYLHRQNQRTGCDQRRINTHCLAALSLFRGPKAHSASAPDLSFRSIDPYHSCQVGTPSIPRLSSSQLLSNCFAAWLKYRPSVDRAALVREMIAVPAEPEKPEMNSAMTVVS
jgi:hypothetical protein